jgi:hypothetical protein
MVKQAPKRNNQSHQHNKLSPTKLFWKKLFPISTHKILYFETRFANMIPNHIKPQILQASFIPVGDRHFIPQAQLRSSFERKAQSI